MSHFSGLRLILTSPTSEAFCWAVVLIINEKSVKEWNKICLMYYLLYITSVKNKQTRQITSSCSLKTSLKFSD